MESYYDALGVAPDVNAAQLRRAYRRAVKQAHPDTGGSAEAFTAVQAAWHTLSDPTRRSRYDDRNRAATPASATRPAPSAWTAAPPPGQPQPGPDARSTSEAASSSGTKRTAWITAGLILASVATGALTWLIIADIGSLFAVLGCLYLVAITWCLVARRRGSSHGSKTLARLLRGAWLLAAAILLLGLATWASTDRDPVPALIWTAIIVTFAAATTVLGRATMNEPE